MINTSIYKSPLGSILLASKDNKLIGLWFENQKYYAYSLKSKNLKEEEDEVLIKTKSWLDHYFNGEQPDMNELDLKLEGTEFQILVWNILKEIPYGKVITYKDIADKIAELKNLKSMSSQAVGTAVGHNPISIIIPCHRVVGTSGNLTGYAGGIDKKIKLLKHEQANLTELYIEHRGDLNV